MIAKILNREWKIESTNHDILMNIYFPQRVILYNLSNIDDEKMLKHCILHEITHAFQAELGQWQNVISNGKLHDEFDSEWIAEFVAIHSEDIIKIGNYIYGHLVNGGI